MRVVLSHTLMTTATTTLTLTRAAMLNKNYARKCDKKREKRKLKEKRNRKIGK